MSIGFAYVLFYNGKEILKSSWKVDEIAQKDFSGLLMSNLFYR